MSQRRTPNRAHLRRTPAERFWEKVDKTDSCWLWTASTTGPGYGQFMVSEGVRVIAHRYAYELLVGPITEGLELDHLCRNRACVNPEHLEQVTRVENIRRSVPFMKDARWRDGVCGNGHDVTAPGAIEEYGQRQCRQCRLETQRRYRAKAVA